MYLIFELFDATYYGTQLTVERSLEPLPIEENGKSIDYYGDGYGYKFNFTTKEEIINAFKWLLENEIYLIGSCMNKQRVCDLLRLLEDVYLGEEFYENFKTNLEWLLENEISACWEDSPFYSSGNTLQLFEKRELVAYVANPNEFKKLVENYLTRTSKFDVIEKVFNKDTAELKRQTRINGLKSELNILLKRKEEIEKELKELEN